MGTTAPELIQARVISGRGSLRIPADRASQRKYWLYADLLRYPDPHYINNKYASPKGNFATMQFRKGEYVLRTEVMEYEGQGWTFDSDPVGQVLYQSQCIANTITENMKRIAQAQGLVVVASPFQTADILSCDYDDIVVQCRDGALISLRLWSQPFQLCPDQQPSPTPPPNPDPPPNPPSPPGTPADGTDPNTPPISPPYDPNPDPSEYNPDPIDAPEPEPPETDGEQCQKVRVSYKLYQRNANGDPVLIADTYTDVYAPVDVSLQNKQTTSQIYYIKCRGQFGAGGCQPYPQEVVIATTALQSPLHPFSKITSITPVP